MIGIRAIRISGVEDDTMIIVERRDNEQSSKDSIELGMLLSVFSMSLVKRFTMRPFGVDSKNLKLLLSTQYRSLLCKKLVPLTRIDKKHKPASKAVSALKKPNAE